MNEFDILGAAADGMSAQQSAIGVYARNIALANSGAPRGNALEPTFSTTTVANDGDEFVRLVADRGSVPSDGFAEFADDASTASTSDDLGDEDANLGGNAPLVAMSGTHAVARRADALGEMVSAMNAQRAFEANASIFELGKRLAERTIDAGNP